jgi:hypothetical protein
VEPVRPRQPAPGRGQRQRQQMPETEQVQADRLQAQRRSEKWVVWAHRRRLQAVDLSGT